VEESAQEKLFAELVLPLLAFHIPAKAPVKTEKQYLFTCEVMMHIDALISF